MVKMIIREAKIMDIDEIQVIRNSVKENVLSNPNLVTHEHCREYLTKRGKGWVCEINGKIQGFAIADLQENNIWALFLHPNYEGKGIGRKLQRKMLDWYFLQGKEKVWLGTEPSSRAEQFYRKSGWREVGKHGNHEIKFEMTLEQWEKLKH